MCIRDSSIPSYYLDLADWMRDYYVTTDRAIWSCLLPSGLQSKSMLKPTKDKATKTEKLYKLSSSQSNALKNINSSNTTLLHGVTGSGKTEVYLHAIAGNIKKSKSTILLVPEIMLTTQIENRPVSYTHLDVYKRQAVNILTRTPIDNVTAKPFMIGCPKLYKIIQVISVDILESRILLQALLNPDSRPASSVAPSLTSSFHRSNIKILASTAIPILNINPAIPASVKTIGKGVATLILNISMFISVYIISATLAITPASL